MALTVVVNDCDEEKLAARQAINENLETVTASQTHWYEASNVEEYRRWRREGLNGYPKPFHHPEAKMIQIPSTHGDHSIPLRVIPPQSPVKGVYLHFHAGGMVIGSASSHDALLHKIATETELTVVSVEYRLAPEHIFPAGPEDCLDAALFALSTEGETKLGGRLRVIAGESAGGYLTVATTLSLRARGINVREKIDAIVPGYGIFDYTYTPSMWAHKRRIIMGFEDARKFIETAIPLDKFPMEIRKQPKFSPLFDDLTDLPPALFVCGTADPLLDDSVFMANKYYLAGNTTELQLVREGCHGFTLFPIGEVAEEGVKATIDFVVRSIRSI